MRKINQYKRTYHKEFGALGAILFIGFIAFCSAQQVDVTTPATLSQEQLLQPIVVEVATTTIAKPLTEQEQIIAKIREYFPKNADVMVAIAKAESHLNPKAIGYNCYYNADETIVYDRYVVGTHSTHCKDGHQKFAWSIDCGLLQRNYPGLKICPKETIDEHLEDVSNLSRVQGLQAWSAYNNNSYKKYLTVN